jgi:metallo-beta-lactamase class B
MRVIVKALIASALVVVSAQVVTAQDISKWSKAQKPFHIFGNTYYVGTQGLSAMLITSREGHVLIDGTVPEAAKSIAANIRTLGFHVEDVKLIVNSHVHFDHAGGIAELQKLTGAAVAASPASAKVLQSGNVDKDDPQFGSLPKIAPVKRVKIIKDGEVLTAGSIAITAHFTPGHTPGGTSWTWQSCEQPRCLNMVYADSLNPISAKGYLYSDPNRNPNGAKLLEQSFKVVSDLDCDILIAPHPELVDVFGKLEQREGHGRDAFIDRGACKAYVAAAREKLRLRLIEEGVK